MTVVPRGSGTAPISRTPIVSAPAPTYTAPQVNISTPISYSGGGQASTYSMPTVVQPRVTQVSYTPSVAPAPRPVQQQVYTPLAPRAVEPYTPPKIDPTTVRRDDWWKDPSSNQAIVNMGMTGSGQQGTYAPVNPRPLDPLPGWNVTAGPQVPSWFSAPDTFPGKVERELYTAVQAGAKDGAVDYLKNQTVGGQTIQGIPRTAQSWVEWWNNPSVGGFTKAAGETVGTVLGLKMAAENYGLGSLVPSAVLPVLNAPTAAIKESTGALQEGQDIYTNDYGARWKMAQEAKAAGKSREEVDKILFGDNRDLNSYAQETASLLGQDYAKKYRESSRVNILGMDFDIGDAAKYVPERDNPVNYAVKETRDMAFSGNNALRVQAQNRILAGEDPAVAIDGAYAPGPNATMDQQQLWQTRVNEFIAARGRLARVNGIKAGWTPAQVSQAEQDARVEAQQLINNTGIIPGSKDVITDMVGEIGAGFVAGATGLDPFPKLGQKFLRATKLDRFVPKTAAEKRADWLDEIYVPEMEKKVAADVQGLPEKVYKEGERAAATVADPNTGPVDKAFAKMYLAYTELAGRTERAQAGQQAQSAIDFVSRLTKGADSPWTVIQRFTGMIQDPHEVMRDAPELGNIPISVRAEMAKPVMTSDYVLKELPNLESLNQPEFNHARFMVEFQDLAQRAAARINGVGEKPPTALEKIVGAQKAVMGEMYLRNPGYVFKQVMSDYATMAADGVVSFDSRAQIDDFMARMGVSKPEISNELNALGDPQGRESLWNKVPVVGKVLAAIPDKVGDIAAQWDFDRRVRAQYAGTKKYLEENWKPILTPEVRQLLGDNVADAFEANLRGALSTKELREVARRHYDPKGAGDSFSATQWMQKAGIPLDSISPQMLVQMENGARELANRGATPEETKTFFDKWRGEIDKHWRKNVASMGDVVNPRQTTENVARADIDEVQHGATQLVKDLVEVGGMKPDEAVKRIDEVMTPLVKGEEVIRKGRESLAEKLSGIVDKPDVDVNKVASLLNWAMNKEYELRGDYRQQQAELYRKARTELDNNRRGPTAAEAWAGQVWREYFDNNRRNATKMHDDVANAYHWTAGAVDNFLAGADWNTLSKEQPDLMSIESYAQKLIDSTRAQMDAQGADGFSKMLASDRVKGDQARQELFRRAVVTMRADPSISTDLFDVLMTAEKDVRMNAAKAATEAELVRDQMVTQGMDMKDYYTRISDIWKKHFDFAEQRNTIAMTQLAYTQARNSEMGRMLQGLGYNDKAIAQMFARMDTAEGKAAVQKEIAAQQQKLSVMASAQENTTVPKIVQETISRTEGISRTTSDYSPARDRVETYLREQFRDLPDNQMKAAMAVMDARAEIWAKQNNTTPDGWYSSRLATADEAPAQVAPIEKWFGQSKVVNPDGSPKEVYHFTNQDFSAFDLNKIYDKRGFFFIDNPDLGKQGDYSKGMPVYLKMENPYRATWDQARNDFYRVLFPILDKHNIGYSRGGIEGKELFLKNPDRDFDAFAKYDEEAKALVRERLKAQGYDGIMISPDNPNGKLAIEKGTTYVVFDPADIKSSRSNSGEFDPNNPNIYAQDAYHGGPHRFDKFSTDKINTGEGAQAYGWGLYFAGKKEIAEWYRTKLTEGNVDHPDNYKFTVNGEVIKSPTEEQNVALNFLHGNTDAKARDLLEQAKRADAGNPDSVPYYQKVEQWLNDYAGQKIGMKQPDKGQLYKVDIPDDGAYLLWDKPLSEQPEAVKKAIGSDANVLTWTDESTDKKNIYRASNGWRIESNGDGGYDVFAGKSYQRSVYGLQSAKNAVARLSGKNSDVTGAAFYKDMAERLGKNKEMPGGWNAQIPDDQAASMKLKELGLAGVKYLDGSSRDAGEGTYNYVIFDDKNVNIKETYYQGPKGAVEFLDDGRAVIKALNSPDISTLMHEVGHVFRRDLQGEDLGIASEWAGAKKLDNGEWQWGRDAEEKFARGFEKYLQDGEAPNVGLRRVFDQFKTWLTTIYSKLRGVLPDTMSDQMRGVYDRLLAERVDQMKPPASVDEFARMRAAPDMSPDTMRTLLSEAQRQQERVRGETDFGKMDELKAVAAQLPDAVEVNRWLQPTGEPRKSITLGGKRYEFPNGWLEAQGGGLDKTIMEANQRYALDGNVTGGDAQAWFDKLTEAKRVRSEMKAMLADGKRQYEKTAKAAGDAMSGWQNIIDDLQQRLGQNKVDEAGKAAQEALSQAQGDVDGAIETLTNKYGDNPEKFAAVLDALQAMQTESRPLNQQQGKAAPTEPQPIDKLVTAVQQLVDTLQPKPEPPPAQPAPPPEPSPREKIRQIITAAAQGKLTTEQARTAINQVEPMLRNMTRIEEQAYQSIGKQLSDGQQRYIQPTARINGEQIDTAHIMQRLGAEQTGPNVWGMPQNTAMAASEPDVVRRINELQQRIDLATNRGDKATVDRLMVERDQLQGQRRQEVQANPYPWEQQKIEPMTEQDKSSLLTLSPQQDAELKALYARAQARFKTEQKQRMQLPLPEVRDANFASWFGKSIARDKQGNPLTLYHFTRNNFDAFDPARLGAATKHPNTYLGFFFGSSPEISSVFVTDETQYDRAALHAEAVKIYNKEHGTTGNPSLKTSRQYADFYDAWNAAIYNNRLGFAEGAQAMPVNLSIQKPYYMPWKDWHTVNGLAKTDRAQAIAIAKDLRATLEGMGYDAIILPAKKNSTNPEWLQDTYIVFKPEQIKSAIGNKGTFDPNNPNILYQDQPTPTGRPEDNEMAGTDFAKKNGLFSRLGETDPETLARYQDRAVENGAVENVAHMLDINDAVHGAGKKAIDAIEKGFADHVANWQPGEKVYSGQERGMMQKELLRLTQQHSEVFSKAREYGKQLQNSSLLDYSDKRGIDTYIQLVAPFAYWGTRQGRNYALRAMANPNLVATYWRYQQAVEAENKKKNVRGRFGASLQVPGTNLYVDPTPWLFPFSDFMGRDSMADAGEAKSAAQKAYDLAGMVGIRPGPLLDIPLRYSNLLVNKSPGEQGYGAQEAEYGRGSIGELLPLNGIIQTATAAFGIGGPTGFDAEGRLRKMLGMHEAETWEPYVISRSISDMAAQANRNGGPMDTRAYLIAQRFVDDNQSNIPTALRESTAQQLSDKYHIDPQMAQQALDIARRGALTATLQKGTQQMSSFFTGLRVKQLPPGEQARWQMKQYEKGAAYNPYTDTGSRKQLQQVQDFFPALQVQRAQYGAVPGDEKNYNYLYVQEEKKRLNAKFDDDLANIIRERPWDRDAAKEIDGMRFNILRQLDQMQGTTPPDETKPSSIYGANKAEALQIRQNDILRLVSKQAPKVENFESYDQYKSERDAYRSNVASIAAGNPQTQAILQLADKEGNGDALRKFIGGLTYNQVSTYKGRYDLPLEAAQNAYFDLVYEPAILDYNRQLVRGDPRQAWENTIGRVGAVDANALASLIKQNYGGRWTDEELAQGLQGMSMPILAEMIKRKYEVAADGGFKYRQDYLYGANNIDPQTEFWRWYRNEIPPGRAANGLRDIPQISSALDPAAAAKMTPAQWESALNLGRAWMASEFGDVPPDARVEWAQAKDESKQLNTLLMKEFGPEGQKLLDMYFNAPDAKTKAAMRKAIPMLDALLDMRQVYAEKKAIYDAYYGPGSYGNKKNAQGKYYASGSGKSGSSGRARYSRGGRYRGRSSSRSYTPSFNYGYTRGYTGYIVRPMNPSSGLGPIEAPKLTPRKVKMNPLKG